MSAKSPDHENAHSRASRGREPTPWQTLSQERVFAAPPFLEVWRQTVMTGSGKAISDFYKVKMRPYVVCVPFLSDGRVLMVRQFKQGPQKVCLTFPGGFIDPRESPEEACRRELLEETGADANELTHLGRFVDNGNQEGCTGDYFCAHGVQMLFEPNPDPHEEIVSVALSPDDVTEALRRGDLGIVHHAAAWGLAQLFGR